MAEEHTKTAPVAPQPQLRPAPPLWRIAPTRGGDGRCLADFMMLIPGLGAKPPAYRDQVTQAIREVCESYRERVAFADVNYAINVLWVSVAAEPGLGGRVAASVRERVPEALLIGGLLGTACALPAAVSGAAAWRQRLQRWSRRAVPVLGKADD